VLEKNVAVVAKTVNIFNINAALAMHTHIIVKRVSWFKSSLLLRINNKHTYKY